MRIVIPLLIFLITACGGRENLPTATAAEPYKSTDESSDNLVDKIKLVDLENNPIDLADFKGQTVFLNFWATWCKPCILEMPSIERAQQQLRDENFVFLLASDESIDKIKRFQNTRNFDLPFVSITESFADLGIYSIPATLVIDPTGKITWNQVGALEWDAPEVLEKLRSNSL